MKRRAEPTCDRRPAPFAQSPNFEPGIVRSPENQSCSRPSHSSETAAKNKRRARRFATNTPWRLANGCNWPAGSYKNALRGRDPSDLYWQLCPPIVAWEGKEDVLGGQHAEG
jgi:hypothetical protein